MEERQKTPLRTHSAKLWAAAFDRRRALRLEPFSLAYLPARLRERNWQHPVGERALSIANCKSMHQEARLKPPEEPRAAEELRAGRARSESLRRSRPAGDRRRQPARHLVGRTVSTTSSSFWF